MNYGFIKGVLYMKKLGKLFLMVAFVAMFIGCANSSNNGKDETKEEDKYFNPSPSFVLSFKINGIECFYNEYSNNVFYYIKDYSKLTNFDPEKGYEKKGVYSDIYGGYTSSFLQDWDVVFGSATYDSSKKDAEQDYSMDEKYNLVCVDASKDEMFWKETNTGIYYNYPLYLFNEKDNNDKKIYICGNPYEKRETEYTVKISAFTNNRFPSSTGWNLVCKAFMEDNIWPVNQINGIGTYNLSDFKVYIYCYGELLESVNFNHSESGENRQF